MTNGRIAAIVVTYNRCSILNQCLKALIKQTVKCDILVVDNHSTDETSLVVSALQNEGVLYQDTGKNLGGAGGFNFGMRWAVELDYDYLWMMDDDTIPSPTSLEELLNAGEMLNNNYGFLSSGVLWKDGTDCQMNRPRVKARYCKDFQFLQKGIVEIEQATFVSFFCKSKIIKKAGLPIKEFFIWGDDVEFSRRIALQMGYPCYLISSSVVIHAMEQNLGSDLSVDMPDRILRYEYAYRNENYIYRREGIKRYFYWLTGCGMMFIKIILHSNHKITRCAVMIRGIFKGFFFRPQIEYCD